MLSSHMYETLFLCMLNITSLDAKPMGHNIFLSNAPVILC